MSYFRHMPVTFYRGDASGQYVSALDISVRAKIVDYVKNSAGTVLDYNIRDGERPEHLAHRVYGNPEYHWVNLLYNEIHDPFFEWPMSNLELQTMVDRTYVGKAYFIDLPLAQSTQNDFYFEAGSATVNGNNTTVLSWDPNLYKLVVDPNSPGTSSVSDGSIISQRRADGKRVEATIRRVVDDNRYAVHHFVDVDTNETMDHHLFNDQSTVLSDLGQAGASEVVSNVGVLQRYLNGEEVIETADRTIKIKTNIEHEIERNDSKRRIKVMRPEFVEIVVKDLKRVFFGG